MYVCSCWVFSALAKSCVVKACYSAVLLCGTVQCTHVVTKYVRTYVRTYVGSGSDEYNEHCAMYYICDVVKNDSVYLQSKEG